MGWYDFNLWYSPGRWPLLYRVTHLDGYNLLWTQFCHLAWVVGHLVNTVAAHLFGEVPKPKSAGGCNHPDG